jgi:HK97 family phage major capsid protein
MPENLKVLEDVKKEMARIGDDAKAAQETFRKEWADFTDAHKNIAPGMSKAEADELLDKHTTATAASLEECQKRLDAAETAANRSGLPSGEIGDEHKQAIEFKKMAMGLRGAKRRDMVGVDMTVKEMGEYKNALLSAIAKPPDQLTEAEKKTLSVGSDPAGGYLVTPYMSSQVIEKVWETSPIRQLASVETITTDTFKEIVDVDETDAGWVTETGARTGNAGTPEIAMLSIPVDEMYCIPKATQVHLEDAGMNVEAWLAGKIAAKMGRVEATAFISGSGLDQPKGLTAYASGTTWKTLEQTVIASVTLPTYAEMLTFYATLKEPYHNNATFLMNRTGLATLMTIVDGDSSFIFKPEFKAAGVPATISGYPVRFAADLADPAANAKSWYLGDFAQGYKVVDRLGVSILRDPYSSKPYVQFYARKRVGGSLLQGEAIKSLVCDAT